MTTSDSQFAMTIDGQAVVGAATIPVVDPATEEVIGHAPDCSPTQLDHAVSAARKAHATWRDLSAAQRRSRLLAMPAAILAHLDRLALLLSREQGKTVADAMLEIRSAAQYIQVRAEDTWPGFAADDGPDQRGTSRRVPLGVVALLLPSDFPVLLACCKAMLAMLAGNAVLLKPSQTTPLSVLKIGELVRGVLPSGLLGVLSGSEALGLSIIAHPGIDKIWLTGSNETGRLAMRHASLNLKPLALEVGGNDAAIVLADVDVKKVAPQLFWASFVNNGQASFAAKRLYVHRDIYPAMANAMVDIARTVRMGNGRDHGVELGPVRNRREYERVVRLLEEAGAAGLRFLAGGEVRRGKGYFVPPTLVDNPPDNARIVREETCGPVRSLLKFNDVDDAIARANESAYGLSASVWSSDVELALSIARRLEVRTVRINEANGLGDASADGTGGLAALCMPGGGHEFVAYTAPRTLLVCASAPDAT